MITRGESFSTTIAVERDKYISSLTDKSPLALSLADLQFFDRSRGGFDLNKLQDQVRYRFEVYIGGVRFPSRVFLSQVETRAFSDDPTLIVPDDAGVTVWEIQAPANYASDLSLFPNLVFTAEYLTADSDENKPGVFLDSLSDIDGTLDVTFEVTAIPSQELDLSIAEDISTIALEAQLDRDTIASKGVHRALERIRRNGFPLQRFDRDLKPQELSAGRIWFDISDHTVKVAVVGPEGLEVEQLIHKEGSIDSSHFAGAVVDEDNIIDGAVTTDKIKDEAVTKDKLAEGARAVDAIAPLSGDGTASNPLTIADGAIGTEQLDDLSVTGGKVAEDTISETKLDAGVRTKLNSGGGGGGGLATVATDTPVSGDGSTGSPVTIADGAIATAKLADGAVTNSKLGANAVNADKLQNGSVTNSKLADGAVTGVKVAENTIVESKLSAGVRAKLDEAGSGGDPAYVKFEVPQQFNGADQIVATAGGSASFHTILLNLTPLVEHANDSDAIVRGGVGPHADIVLKSGVYTFNFAIPVSGLSGSNDRKNVTFRIINRTTRAVLSGDYSATYLRGDTFGGESVIGGSGSVYIPADDTVINIQTGVHAVGGRQSDVNLTASDAGFFEILRNVQSVVETVQDTVVTASPVSGDGSSGDPVTIDDGTIAEAKLDAATQAKLNAEAGVADLSGVVGGSGITVTHSNSNKTATVAVAESLQGELVPGGGETDQALLKQSGADHDLKYANTTNIYEYKAAIDSTSAEGTNGTSTTLMGLNRNVDPSETPAYTGRRVTFPSITGSHFNVPAGQWSVYVTMSLGNANVESVQMQVLIDDTAVPNATVDGVIDDAGNATFITNFTLTETSEFEFNIISRSSSSTVNVRLNQPAGFIYIREGLAGKLNGSDTITVGSDKSISVTPQSIGTAEVKAGSIVPDHLNATNRPALGQYPLNVGNGQVTWTTPESGGGGGGGSSDITIVRYDTAQIAVNSNTIPWNQIAALSFGDGVTDLVGSAGGFRANKEGVWNVYIDIPLGNRLLNGVSPVLNEYSGVTGDLKLSTVIPVTGLGTANARVKGNFTVNFEANDRIIIQLKDTTFPDDTPEEDQRLNTLGGHIEFYMGWDALVPDQAISERKLHDNAVSPRTIRNEAVTLPKLEDASEWVDNGGTIQKDLTRTVDYLLAYKQNQNLDSSIAGPEQANQWVHVNLGNSLELVHSSFIGTNPNTRRTNFGLGIKDGGVAQKHIQDPLNIANFLGATKLQAVTNSGGVIYPTELDSGDWVTEAGTAPGFAFKRSLAGFIINRGRTRQTRTMTHLLVRVGQDSTASQGGDVLREIAINPADSGQGTAVFDEIIVPLYHAYAPPLPSPTNPSLTARGTSTEYLAYNLFGITPTPVAAFSLGIRLGMDQNGSINVDVVSNMATALPDNIWVSFHAVRGIGG